MLRRQAEARRVLREQRALLGARDHESSSGGPPLMMFQFPIVPGPFGPHVLTPGDDDDDDDDYEGPN